MKTKNTKNKIDIDSESMALIEAIAKKNGVSVESVLNRAFSILLRPSSEIRSGTHRKFFYQKV